MEHPPDEGGAEVEREMTMTDQREQGRELMRRAEETMKAAGEARNLRARIEAAKTATDIQQIQRDAEAWRGLLPAHAQTFSDIIAEASAKAARPAKRARRVKDTRPRWAKEHREAYNRKLHNLVADGMSDREAARAAIEWAAGNPKLAQFKTPSESALQKWAAAERALMARKRKRS